MFHQSNFKAAALAAALACVLLAAAACSGSSARLGFPFPNNPPGDTCGGLDIVVTIVAAANCPGGIRDLHVEITGANSLGTFDYQWYLDGVAIEGANKMNLAAPESTGPYTVSVYSRKYDCTRASSNSVTTGICTET